MEPLNSETINTALVSNVSTGLLTDKITREAGISLHILRLDLLHPITGGNKWFKLKTTLSKYLSMPSEDRPVFISFGGCYSNLIAALAQAGYVYGFKTIGIIRGEPQHNITLSRAARHGMKLCFVQRSVFADKHLALKQILPEIPDPLNTVIIPQGAADYDGFSGCKEIINYINDHYDYILCPSATGTTLAGIAATTSSTCIGIAVLKNKSEQMDFIRRFFKQEGLRKNLPEVIDTFHEGGMAKKSVRLQNFLSWFAGEHPEIPLEPVYTGKMMMGVYELLKTAYFKKGSRILCIHTGGLQYLND
jgi:1-aminocyclopropane-1-carboxylate deaminase